jgi:hypothetical protein
MSPFLLYWFKAKMEGYENVMNQIQAEAVWHGRLTYSCCSTVEGKSKSPLVLSQPNSRAAVILAFEQEPGELANSKSVPIDSSLPGTVADRRQLLITLCSKGDVFCPCLHFDVSFDSRNSPASCCVSAPCTSQLGPTGAAQLDGREKSW